MEKKKEISIKGNLYTFAYVKDAWIKALRDAKSLFVQDHTFKGNYSILAIFYSFQALNKESFTLTREEFFKEYYLDLNIGLQALYFMMQFTNLPLYN